MCLKFQLYGGGSETSKNPWTLLTSQPCLISKPDSKPQFPVRDPVLKSKVNGSLGKTSETDLWFSQMYAHTYIHMYIKLVNCYLISIE